MASKKFNFVSPGILLNEVDNSQLPEAATAQGPVIIGRTRRGPGMVPVKVNSMSDFVRVFGDPVPGQGGGDIWRDGNTIGPTYASFAAQAWLANNSPCTMVRLLGAEHTNKTSTGNAGWTVTDVTDTSAGGAYGLFVTTASAQGLAMGHTSSLAAVFYTDATTAVALHAGDHYNSANSAGALFYDTVATSSTNSWLPTSSADAWGEFTAVIGTYAKVVAGTADKYVFNFDRNSDKYIRKVFNTNPIATNSTVTTTTDGYWLGETFDNFLREEYSAGITSAGSIANGMIAGLETNGENQWGDRNSAFSDARTGWFIPQDIGNHNTFQPESAQKLFRLVGLPGSGDWTQKNIKVSIQDIKPPTREDEKYGTFSVVLRAITDSDKAVRIVESYTDCNLNPNSINYVARKIGDKYIDWDDTDRRYREYGNYDNVSSFVRVDVNTDVDAGSTDARFLPFGVYGPPRAARFGNSTEQATGSASAKVAYANSFISSNRFLGPSGSVFAANTNANILAFGIPSTGSFLYPTVGLRTGSTADDLARPQDAYFGATTIQSGTATVYDPSTPESLLRNANNLDIDYGSDSYSPAWYFTLDDLMTGSAGVGDPRLCYVSGSRLAGHSVTVHSGSSLLLTGSGQNLGYNRFTSTFYGGFDGLDITEAEPFRNTLLSGKTELTNYAFNSVKRAIDTISDPEYVEFNLATIPGLTNESLTATLIDACEDRGDALAIIDLKGDMVPSTENTSTAATNRPNVTNTVANLKTRQLNSSYGAAYFPFVRIRDSISDVILDAPASVAALGTIGYSEAVRAPWFAPAGFNRGGLSQGAAGIPVVGVTSRLTARDRDTLYAAGINPIASFPAEGIVVFGQKTLLGTQSALDRINVRRLLILIKKEMSRIAASTLFEQNVEATWLSFKNRAEIVLNNIKGGQGLVDYKVVLDKTTTTPEMIDRNIMYAKIFLKPAQAIEFIALDFVITDTGAGFAD